MHGKRERSGIITQYIDGPVVGALLRLGLLGVHDAGRPIANISPPSQNYSRFFASPVSSVATASAADTTTITTATFFQVNE